MPDSSQNLNNQSDQEVPENPFIEMMFSWISDVESSRESLRVDKADIEASLQEWDELRRQAITLAGFAVVPIEYFLPRLNRIDSIFYGVVDNTRPAPTKKIRSKYSQWLIDLSYYTHLAWLAKWREISEYDLSNDEGDQNIGARPSRPSLRLPDSETTELIITTIRCAGEPLQLAEIASKLAWSKREIATQKHWLAALVKNRKLANIPAKGYWPASDPHPSGGAGETK